MQTYNFWDNIFMADGKYRKIFNSLLIIVGLIFGISITDFSVWTEVVFFITAYCLGVPCVIALGDRDGKLGNWLGILSNVGEMATFAYFGTWGMVVSGLYFGFMHVVGLFRWTNPSQQGDDGKVVIGKMEKEQLYVTIVFFFLGLFALVFFGEYLGFSLGTMNPWVYWANILTFAVSITSQFLMIMGKKVSWLGWGTSNFINFGLNLTSGNFWFMIRDVIYQVNAVASYYQWSKVEKREK